MAVCVFLLLSIIPMERIWQSIFRTR